MKKKICLVMPVFGVGGVEQSVLRLVSILKSRCEVTVVITQQISASTSELESNCRVINLTWLNRLKWLKSVWLKKIAESSDVFINSFDPIAQYLIGRISTPKRVCFVRNNHETMFRMYSINAENVDLYICNSLMAFKKYKTIGNSVFIPNSVDIPRELAKNPKEHYVSQEPCDKIINILFVGRLVDDSKGIFDLPEIFGQLQVLRVQTNYNLIIVGDGVDRKKLQQDLSLKKIPHKFVGALEHTQVLRLMLQSKMIVIPSRYEGLPNVLLEALACGCVPVVRRIVDVTDYILDFSNSELLFDYKSEASKILFNLISNEKYCNAMREKCIVRAKDFSFEMEQSQYVRNLL